MTRTLWFWKKAMDVEEIAKLEAENGFKQLERAIDVIRFYLEPGRPFALRPGLILDMQKLAVEGLVAYPGQWRKTKVGISKSQHEPPPPHLVESLVVEMCEYVNENRHIRNAFHLSSYVMWRHNWIHPFEDGNGRTSRVLSYIILSICAGYVLPGTPTIPEQIQKDRKGYFAALEAADESWKAEKSNDVKAMEDLLKNMLAKQLLSVIDGASKTAS
jgi:Fic family protein